MARTKDDRQLIQVGRLARSAGVSTQTVQYYTMVGLIEEADRTPGGRRLFDKVAVSRVKLINKLNKSGYPLREIREMFLKRSSAR